MRLTLGGLAAVPGAVTPYTPDQIKEYALAMYKITAYHKALDSVNLPYLAEPTDAYTKFSEDYFPYIKAHAQIWLTSILPMYSSIPISIQTFYNNMQIMEAPLKSIINSLISNPTDANNLAKFKKQIGSIRGSIISNAKTVDFIETVLDKFATDMATDLTTLTNAVSEMTKLASTDQDLVNSLNAEIAKLKSELKKWEITVAAMVGVGVTGGVIAKIGVSLLNADPASKVLGGIALALGLLLTAGSVITTIVANSNIRQIQDNIFDDQKNLGPLDADITSINMITSSLQTAIDDNKIASGVMDNIKSLWTLVDQELDQLQIELDDIINLASTPTSQNFTQVLNDFELAMQYWDDLNTVAQDIDMINITYDEELYIIPKTATA
ncbi:MAG: HBL/NHE enterotoxin family protein [Bacteroidetes bacterium]|nr:HBL/NHE enterotoxin family protein [Bacteroidota bacterium]